MSGQPDEAGGARTPVSRRRIDADGFARATDAAGAWDLWFRPCSDEGCDCHEAIVLATREGRDLLEPFVVRVAGVTDARKRAASLDGGAVVAFALLIPAGAAFPMEGEGEPSDRAEAAARSIPGAILDELHERWLKSRTTGSRSKRGPMPTKWRPGDMLSWGQMFPDERDDLYLDDEGWIGLSETFCVNPACDCSDVVLSVHADRGEGWSALGRIRVDYRTGSIADPLAPELADAVARWKARYPDWRIRLANRHATAKRVGARLLLEAPAERLPDRAVSRNADCPCGSGKKYKRCCGAS